MQPQEPIKPSQHSQLDQFKIIKTLGSGLQADVKLGVDQNGTQVAIKKYKTQKVTPQLVKGQVQIIKNFEHENIIKLIDCRAKALYTKKDGTQYQCSVVILEYAGAGQLFDFINISGRFPQKVTRAYFGQLMNGLYHMHEKGFVHRDLKPQNLLLSSYYELKIADFGFSCAKQGKNKNNILKSRLGTQGYMAPQVYQKKYNGQKVDIFAAGVILFVMYSGWPPFQKATSNDPYFKQIICRNYQKFWSYHERVRNHPSYTQEFKDLINKMIANDPTDRLSIFDISKHPWIQKEISTYEQIKTQFADRKKKVDEQLQKQRQQYEKKKQAAKKHMKQQGKGNMRRSQTLDYDQKYIQDIREQIHRQRKIPVFSSIQKDDLVLKQDPAYVIVELKNFLNNFKFNIFGNFQKTEQVIGLNKQQLLHLEKLQDNQNNEIVAQFNQTFEDEQEDITNKFILRFYLGKDTKNNVVLRIQGEQGNWWIYRRLEGEIKKHFMHLIVQ